MNMKLCRNQTHLSHVGKPVCSPLGTEMDFNQFYAHFKEIFLAGVGTG